MNIQHAENYWVVFNVTRGKYLARPLGRGRFCKFATGAAFFESELHAGDAIYNLRGMMDRTYEVRNLLTEFINQDATLYTQPELPLAQNEEEEKDDRRNDRPDSGAFKLIRGGQRAGKTIAGAAEFAAIAGQQIRAGQCVVYDPRTKSFHGYTECK